MHKLLSNQMLTGVDAYSMSASDQAQMWQNLRDEANYVRTAYESDEQRKATLYATAIGNEAGASGEKNSSSSTSLINLISTVFGG
jgi:hypothetical protein